MIESQFLHITDANGATYKMYLQGIYHFFTIRRMV